MNLKKIGIYHLIFLLGFVILFIPPLLLKPAFCDFFGLIEGNQLGSTFDGITAPFINSIAAILVFIAFKEQVKANNLIKEQQYFQHIQEQIYRLEDNFIDLDEVIKEIKKNINGSINIHTTRIGEAKPLVYNINSDALNKIIYSTVIFEQTIDLINQLNNNKEFMKRKIRTLYVIMYEDNYLKLDVILKKIIGKNNSELYVAEALLGIKKLQEIKNFSIS
jgi:hypothetical protein